MPEPQIFRQYLISQNRDGGTVELWRSDDEVACLAADSERRILVELHVAIGPPQRQRSLVPFQRLVRTAMSLRHRNLPEILEGGEDDGAAFFVSDFLAGERLGSWLARCAPLPEWLALHVAQEVAAGLCALAPHPGLLAGVNLLHAGATMEGQGSDGLTVRLCDLGLTVERGVREGPREIEARAIRDTGSLLRRMLGGSDTQPPVGITPELGFLLDAICRTDAPHHPRTVDQLFTLVERCRRELTDGRSAGPERIPAALQPDVPARAHFLSPAAAQDAVGSDYTIDPNSFDAAHPWQLHGIHRSTREPVTVQILPPDALLPRDWYAAGLRDAARETAGDLPGLLRLLDWHEDTSPEALVEERIGRWTLASIVARRGKLDLMEVLMVLERIEEAAAEAESAGLPAFWRDPSAVAFRFESPPRADAAFGRASLLDWPPFSVKLRTWPVTTDFAQPARSGGRHLIVPGADDARMSGEPEAGGRDFAVLAAWMAGGISALPDPLVPLVLEWTGSRAPDGPRAAFLDDLRHRMDQFGAFDSPDDPGADAGDYADDYDDDSPGWMGGGYPPESGDPAEAPGNWEPEADAAEPADAPGFAALFSQGAGGPPADETPARPPAARRTSARDNAVSRPPQRRDESFVPRFDRDAVPPDHPPQSGRWMIWLMVVLIAAIIGGIAAQISGMAFWQ